MMQAAYRGYICRAKWAQRKAAIKIQLFYRKNIVILIFMLFDCHIHFHL